MDSRGIAKMDFYSGFILVMQEVPILRGEWNCAV
jgi:hypothetical protein